MLTNLFAFIGVILLGLMGFVLWVLSSSEKLDEPDDSDDWWNN